MECYIDDNSKKFDMTNEPTVAHLYYFLWHVMHVMTTYYLLWYIMAKFDATDDPPVTHLFYFLWYVMAQLLILKENIFLPNGFK